MKGIVKNQRENSRHPNDIVKHVCKAFTYGEQSLRILGPKVWNSLPENIKMECNFEHFKVLINTWDGFHCNCKMCTFVNRDNV